MLTEYVEHAMRKARYEIMENGRFFGAIPPCRGCWGEGPTLEECRDELRGALECWILVGVRHGDKLPVIDGTDQRGGASAPSALTPGLGDGGIEN